MKEENLYSDLRVENVCPKCGRKLKTKRITIKDFLKDKGLMMWLRGIKEIEGIKTLTDEEIFNDFLRKKGIDWLFRKSKFSKRVY